MAGTFDTPDRDGAASAARPRRSPDVWSRDMRAVWAAALVVAGLCGAVASAQLGDLRLGAGDMAIRLGKGEHGLHLAIARRACPPRCGVDLAWTPGHMRLGLEFERAVYDGPGVARGDERADL